MNAVFHWLADKREALRQIVRVLKRGGRLGISTGAKGNPNPLHSVRARVLARPPYNQYPTPSEAVIYRVSTPELETLLTEAGFHLERLESRPTPRPQLTPEAAIQFSEASSFGNFLGNLPQELRGQAREDIKRELEATGELASTGAERFQIVAIAIKP
jgi:SAM-dependent methyltransferase